MEDIVKSVSEKISSYNIFNNLLPGIAFCYILDKITRFTIANGSLLENLFIYYFVGMIISRIGSLIVEPVLTKVKIKKIGPFIKRCEYKDYIAASKDELFIEVLNETNNLYRTTVSICFSLLVAKIYDWKLHDILINMFSKEWLVVLAFIVLMTVFVVSYKKQTNYINKRIENYIEKKGRK